MLRSVGWCKASFCWSEDKAEISWNTATWCRQHAWRCHCWSVWTTRWHSEIWRVSVLIARINTQPSYTLDYYHCHQQHQFSTENLAKFWRDSVYIQGLDTRVHTQKSLAGLSR